MIKVDENTCIGCGACMAIAPENFDFNDNGLSQVISQEVTESTHEAANACPVSAISVSVSEKKDNIIEFNNTQTENNEKENDENNNMAA